MQDLTGYPRMTRWFDPRLLAKLLLQVIVSKLFGQYADRRLLIAALDGVDKAELHRRAELDLAPDEEGAVWFDYVSDLGDGFDATYAIAYCLAQERLAVEGAPEPLPRGGLLVMGGDEVYPTSSRNDYDTRLRAPYELAYPSRPDDVRHPPVFLIPGNHDWYDGLVSFLAMFCRRKPTAIGNWRTQQRRSYFALRLTANWWLWAIDIALTEDMDQPQADYFVTMAEAMPQGSRIVLCTAEPGWYDADDNAAAFRTLLYAAKLASHAATGDGASKGFRIIAALSGDTHHYARYASQFGTAFVTSGGGGAFLHGTHGLRPEIELDWLAARAQRLSLAACYPDKAESRRLLVRNLAFPITNADSAAALGAIYWLFAIWLAATPRLDVRIIVFLAFCAGFGLYARYQERGKIAAADLEPSEEPDEIVRNVEKGKAVLSVLAPPLAQASAHVAALLGLSWLFGRLNDWLLGAPATGWTSVFLLLPEMVIGGGLVGGLVFGAYLLVTSRFFDLSHNDAFSAMRLDRYRHFLRLRIQDDRLTIYPIGLDRVPTRRDWRPNPEAGRPPVGSAFIQPDIIRPRLIEEPVVIDAAHVAPIAEAAKPASASGTGAGSSVVAPTDAPNAAVTNRS